MNGIFLLILASCVLRSQKDSTRKARSRVEMQFN